MLGNSMENTKGSVYVIGYKMILIYKLLLLFPFWDITRMQYVPNILW